MNNDNETNRHNDALVKSFNDNKDRLPCPFCGHTATAFWSYTSDWDSRFHIGCDNCNCEMKSSDWSELVENWNRRNN